jgi:hypothetical protein
MLMKLTAKGVEKVIKNPSAVYKRLQMTSSFYATILVLKIMIFMQTYVSEKI